MNEIPKAYEPQTVEDKWYDFWQKQGCFTANEKSAKPAYSIVIPPPNVTGMLHMGHVLNNTIQDILARKARMDGKEVLWLPGTDHAGIATQVMVEKQLKKEEKKSRHDLGREEFLKRVWVWKEKHGSIIINQLKKLGSSCDWTRERFTMDPEYSKCVQKVFVELYKKGFIYRGKRMVNWCPVSQTALSDEEVDMKPQHGFMYYFKVQVAEVVGQASRLSQTLKDNNLDGDRRDACPTAENVRLTDIWLTIATTRPETIPGDTAVAVNPKDPRYASLIGKFIVRPLPAELPLAQKLIPIVGDDHVDYEFGTGVLKVTPAHDKADFEIGRRHKLPFIEVISADGTMNAQAGAALAGLDRFKARKVAVELLTAQGVFVEEKPYENNVGFSQRAGVPIEPRLSEQWFLKYPAVEQSRSCVEQEREMGSAPASGAGASALAGDSGRVQQSGNPATSVRARATDGASAAAPGAGALPKMQFYPQRWAKVYDHWLENIQDWCISRQLWWGHRIPVWYRGDEVYCGLQAPQGDGWTQDPDVLDTWFSSWLWPFATMGWPEKTETLKKFYPTTDLVTGPDIIFFWVARMIMAGHEFMGGMPFKNVYFTGIIRDKQGRKMSKTLGNSPDPLKLIAQYGADALRFGTMRSAPLGQDVLFDEKDVELGRNFCNKLWNACRFRQMQGSAGASPAPEGASPEQFEIQGEINPALLTPDDQWILLKLDAVIRELNTAFAEYKFSEATAALYRFFWNEYCDWYVEASKAVFFGTDAAQKANTVAVIDFVLSHTLRLFHPFLPFITEELWHGMGYATDMPDNQGGQTIMNAPWPKPLDDDFKSFYGLAADQLAATDAKYDLIKQGRNLRLAGNIQAAKKVKYVFAPASPLTPHDAEVIRLLLNAESLEVKVDFLPPKGTPAVKSALGELFLPLEGLIDVAAEKIRLTKELEKAKTEIVKVEQKLANPNFTQKVPPAVLEEHKKRLADWQAKLAHTQSSLAALG
jgi:valyl-tRNA synthetase